MKKIIATVGLALATHANAGMFVSNYGQWSRLTDSQKSGYAMGLNDGLMVVGSDPAGDALTMGVDACLGRMNFTNEMTVKFIESGYADTAAWSKPPLVIFLDGMNRMCRDDINRQRTNRGLKPLP